MHNYKIYTAFRHPAQQAGLSLIELMIAMTLGLIVILGVTQSLTTLMASSRIQLDRNDLAQNTDIATNFLGYEFRNSLSAPCDSFSRMEEIDTHAIDGKANNGEGTEVTINTTVANTISNLVKTHGITTSTRQLTIAGNQYHSDEATFIGSPKKLHISQDSGMAGDDLVINAYINPKETLFTITNCDELSLFRASATYDSSSNKTTLSLFNHPTEGKTQFKRNYRELDRAMVSPLTARRIFINSDGKLFNRSLYNTSSPPLFEGVELVRMLFSIDKQGRDGIADTYVTASQLNDLISKKQITAKDSVLSVELFILAKTNTGTQNTGLPSTQTFTLPNTSKPIGNDGTIPTEDVTFNDRTMRQVFTRSITFRSQAAI